MMSTCSGPHDMHMIYASMTIYLCIVHIAQGWALMYADASLPTLEQRDNL